MLTYKTIQSAAWTSTFELVKLFSNVLALTMTEFSVGLRFEFFYWIEEYAACFNILSVIEPITVTLTTSSAAQQCAKTLIAEPDNFNIWKDPDAMWLDDCGLSSSSEVTLYTIAPVEEEQERYFFGEELYRDNFCWPGRSPFYSYLD